MQQESAAYISSNDSSIISNPSEIEARSLEIGQQIFKDSSEMKVGVFNRSYWQDQMIALTTKNPMVKTQLFRFVDVLPVLKTFEQKRDHLIEYLSKPGGMPSWPLLLSFASSTLKVPGLDRMIVKIADAQVAQMGETFIVGQTADEVLPKVEKLRSEKVGFTLDVLGEAVVSEIEAQHYIGIYERLITRLSELSQSWEDLDPTDFTPLGPIPKVNVSIKISAFDALTDALSYEDTLDRLEKRVEPILRLAMDNGVFVNFDMEQYSMKEITMDLFKRLLMKPGLKDYRHFGIVVQAYYKSSKLDVANWIEFADQRGTPFTIRLVKGAYWDYETILADQHGWECPVFSQKWQSDRSFEDCGRLLLEAYPRIELAAGSHNIRSISYLMALAELMKLPKNAFEIQMLYGMSSAFRGAFLKRGMRFREYCPMGEMLPGLSYLVRRLLENTSNDSFLKQSFMDRENLQRLLKRPGPADRVEEEK